MDFYQRQLVWQDISVNWEDLNYSLGKGYRPEGDVLLLIRELERQVSRLCKPCYGYRSLLLSHAEPAWIELEGCLLHTGSIITPFLKDAERCLLFVATAGKEFELFQQEMKRKGNIMEEYLLDALGTAIAEATVRKMCDDVVEGASLVGCGVSYPYSPGYCGWHVSDQQILFSQLPERPCGVELNAASLMCPIKSVSGIVAVGHQVFKQKYGCELCGKKDCYKNKKEK